MPVGSTPQPSVQVLGFGDIGHLTRLRRLIRFLFVRPAFCLRLPSDSQSPATPLPFSAPTLDAHKKSASEEALFSSLLV
jgi:hypothetical protein